MLPEMFCSANDCACRPDTAVVNASKIPMTLPLQLDPQLDERRVTTSGPSPRISQQVPCHSIYSYESMPYADGAATARGWICRPTGRFCRVVTFIVASANATAPCERQVRRVLIIRQISEPMSANPRTLMRFEGTSAYVATDDLKIAVNAAIALERPLLVKGEPGTGKTVLAIEIAKALSAPLLEWHIKSTTKALQGLYEYDAVTRLRDSQLGDARVKDIRNYIKRGKLWDAFVADERPVLLIDEIDKADIEFPNDLLQELDRMEFFVYETGETIAARRRPIVVITSNNEKELPDAFLRRCFFHYIRFPDKETMEKIVDVHFPGLKKSLLREALEVFFEVREVPGLKKKPSTSELLDWLKLLLAEDISPETLRSKDRKTIIPPLHGALLKNEQDVHLFERVAFLSRRER